ncbi:hypothetical protein GCE86_14245 [Micromonospora terminaliae]|uniref:Integral membrane protein n=1 Tax=Micromonospora terminaliae TaxID=1914461 RepID=A0AAJ3DHY5_9ACTN|nr:hypothetical protein [Micromonospora terminaliae]NES27154.1 hypothetical protein [Micromonospora terminaliae]QGL48082.1 hypothetical protein GCE86_14245 [Micromonospora terminaliae]
MSDTPRSADERPVEVVEVRVHGVSGAGPEQVLDRPNVHQVAGDRSGGFYRPRAGYPDTTGAGGVLLEAYRWRDLPSGRAVRTLSLVFLLPFMLGNMAIWMHPPGAGLSAATVKALCRLLALTLTAVYVVAVAGVTLDLIAWKCMGSPRCLTGRNWLSWLGERPPGLRLAVLALVPVAAVALVWRLSSRPGWTYATFRSPDTVSGEHQLTAVSQWDTAPLVSRLRAIHVAAAFATLDAVLLAARSAGGRASVATTALLVLTAAVLAACVVLVCVHPLLDRATPAPRVERNLRRLRTTACLLTLAVVVVVVAEPGPWAARTGLPGYGEIVSLLFATQTVLLVVLGAAVLRARPRVPGGPRLRALGAPVIDAVAAGVGVAYSAELVYRVADLLDRSAPTAERLATSPPLAYKWAIFGFFLAVTVAAVAGIGMALASRPARRRAAADIVARDHPDAPAEADERRREVEKVVARARFTERLTPLVLTYAALAGLGLATSTLGLQRWYPGDVIDRWTPIPAELVNFGIGLGSYVIAAAIVGLVLGGLFAYRTPEFRRYVGVLWDLGTFWPRAAHPFAPPCYAERAVPELSRRISYLTGPGRTVLLAGHSHGSILLAATVLQLPPEVCARVALLTSGSPLTRLYARWFPAYVHADVLHEIGERVGWRWINLWRDTDAIGGWIFAPERPGGPPPAGGPEGSVDRRLRDPRGLVAPPSDTVPPAIVGHLPGATDPRHNEAVRELADRLRDTATGPPAS